MPLIPGQTCTLCSWCTMPAHIGASAHIVQQHPSCTMTDEKHVPTPPRCTCTKIIDPPPPTWLHNPNCTQHP